jgi:hypothetical protein
MNSTQCLPVIAADDISFDKTDYFADTIQIIECDQNNSSVSDAPVEIKPLNLELPPPHRFRREASSASRKVISGDLKRKPQNIQYLASYRKETGRIINEAGCSLKHLNQDELHEIARQIFFFSKSG